jgi:predicted amidophosphoribosyltransferase
VLRLHLMWFNERMLLSDMKKSIKRCSECGAELRQGLATCPLCGADRDAPAPNGSWTPPFEVDSYQSNVRQLREQLKKLRDDHPEAV